MSKQIAIYWWAFNPPTLWHSHVIKQIFKNTNIEQIIITPDWVRKDKDYKINEESRNELINIFLRELKQDWYDVVLDNYFLKWKNKSDTTTYEVDKYFISKLGNQPYHIFWTDISEWIKNWSWNPNKYIQKKLKKIFIPRKWYTFNHYDLENYQLINVDFESNISSTQIKEKISKKNKIDNLVTYNVKKYIINNNLY